MSHYLSALEAAAELNVSRATLYAYVSRGLIRSEGGPGRSRLYHAEDVRGLRARKSPPTDPGGDALNWGAPVLESAITLIADGRLYYRGRDAVRLAESAGLESIASLLWQCQGNDPFASPARLPPLPQGLSGIGRAQAALAAAAAQDLQAYNLEPAGVARTGAAIVRLLAATLTGQDELPAPLHAAIARAWRMRGEEAAQLVRMALVLCADHELNASAFAVRVVASTRATPYAAVLAGLAALQGPRHGGQSAQVAALLDELAQADDVTAGVARRLQRGEPLPGFAHPLYPNGDVRAACLLRALRQALPQDHPQVRFALATAAAVQALTGQRPNIDFALVALARTLGLPDGAPLALFAVGRSVGWIAHAQEQYRQPGLIRPRARYTGEVPQPAP